MSAASFVPRYKLFYLRGFVIIAIYMWERPLFISLTHTLGIPRRKLKVIYETNLIQRRAEEGLGDFILDRSQHASQSTRLLPVVLCTALPSWHWEHRHQTVRAQEICIGITGCKCRVGTISLQGYLPKMVLHLRRRATALCRVIITQSTDIFWKWGHFHCREAHETFVPRKYIMLH